MLRLSVTPDFVAATFISKGTSKVVQGKARKRSRAEYIKLSSTLPSPSQLWPSCVPSFTYSQPPNSHSLPLPPPPPPLPLSLSSSRQPSVSLRLLLVPCAHGTLLQCFPRAKCRGERKQPALMYHLDLMLKLLLYFSNPAFTPSCIGFYWKLFHIKLIWKEKIRTFSYAPRSKQRIVHCITFNSKPKQNVSFVSEYWDTDLTKRFWWRNKTFSSTFLGCVQNSTNHSPTFPTLLCALGSGPVLMTSVMLPGLLTSARSIFGQLETLGVSPSRKKFSGDVYTPVSFLPAPQVGSGHVPPKATASDRQTCSTAIALVSPSKIPHLDPHSLGW